jgi:hypothetical protein
VVTSNRDTVPGGLTLAGHLNRVESRWSRIREQEMMSDSSSAENFKRAMQQYGRRR